VWPYYENYLTSGKKVKKGRAKLDSYTSKKEDYE
jgi:hypothetical protein